MRRHAQVATFLREDRGDPGMLVPTPLGLGRGRRGGPDLHPNDRTRRVVELRFVGPSPMRRWSRATPMTDDLEHLSDRELEDRLRHGRPEERVRAGWILAMRLGGSFDAVGPLHEERHEGVRRHLLTVVAGQGRRDLLRLFSEADPSAAVRSTSVRLSWQCAPASARADEARRIAALAVNDRGVRTTVLEVVNDALPEDFAPELERMLEDSDRDVRSLALPLLLRRRPWTTRRDALRRMLEHAADAQELGSACDVVASFASADEWGHLLAVCNLHVVRRLAAALDRVPRSVAAPAFAVGDPDREVELVDRIAESEAIPVTFLVARTLTKASSRDAWSEARVHSRCAGWLRERAERAPALSPDLQSLVEALARSLEATARRTFERLDADEDSLDGESALDERGWGFDEDFDDDFDDEQEAMKRVALDDYQLALALRGWLERSQANP